MLEIVMD